MREIKFRAWNGVHRRMEEVRTLSLWCEKPMHLWITDEGPSRYDDFPIMQFTRLRDKNGKEIYEGDIIGGTQTMTQNGYRLALPCMVR